MLRRRLPIHLALLPAVLVLAWSVPSQAQVETGIQRGTQTVTGFLGGQFFDLGQQLEDVGTNFDTEVNLGGRYQYFLTERWGLEGGFLYSRGNPQVARAAGADIDVDSFYYSGNVIWNIVNRGRLVPYATGGVGVAVADIRNGGEREDRFAFNFGGGLTYLATERVAIRLDARDYVYDAFNFEADNMLGIPTAFDDTIHDLAVTGGVSLLF